jgi:hypothetical protein
MADKPVGGKRFRPRGLGVGGTIGEIDRQGAPPIKIKWKVGSMSTAGKGNRKTLKHGPRGKEGRLRGKSAPGFGLKVEF